MGLFFKLVTLPVSGPVGGALWIAEQVRAAAERDYHDEGAIQLRLAEVEQRFAAGELTEEEFEVASDELFLRSLEAREFWAQQEAGPVEEVPR